MAAVTRKTRPAAVRQTSSTRQVQGNPDGQDLADWPQSWMGLPEDLLPGRRIVACFQPFLDHLIERNLSRKTLRKHTDNLWVLGGELIRDLHKTPSLRKAPIEQLVFDLVAEGGPLPYHCDSEQDLRSFESTCRKFRRFLEQRQTSS